MQKGVKRMTIRTKKGQSWKSLVVLVPAPSLKPKAGPLLSKRDTIPFPFVPLEFLHFIAFRACTECKIVPVNRQETMFWPLVFVCCPFFFVFMWNVLAKRTRPAIQSHDLSTHQVFSICMYHWIFTFLCLIPSFSTDADSCCTEYF